MSKYIEMAHRYFLAAPLKSAIEVRKRALIQASEAGPKLSPDGGRFARPKVLSR